MNKYLPFLFLLSFLNCKTTSSLKHDDISKLNGRWEMACQATFDAPDDLMCFEMIAFKQIKVDVNTGLGEEKMEDDYLSNGTKTTFKVFKEKKKLMIIYYHASGEEEARGEIIKLDDKELRVKVEKGSYYLIQKRAPSK